MEGVPPNKRPTNMVLHFYAIFPHLSAAENVSFGLRKSRLPNGGKKAAVVEVLRMVSLSGYGGRAAHALSGGQRRSVVLARALILKPKVLLLDEPMSALDRKLRDTMQDELWCLHRQVGITSILVTHDQDEVLFISDRNAVMFNGRIPRVAPRAGLYQRPVSR